MDRRRARGRMAIRPTRSGGAGKGMGDRLRRRERRHQMESSDAETDGRRHHGEGGRVLTGDLDGNLIAYDASIGKELWRNAIGKAIGGGVISYDVGGTQYIAAATGLNAGTWQVKAGPA